jgi:DNA invertase Pin-like site-specific DNA recombinase
MPTHVIYARKSTESDDRQVLSIDSQVQELKLLALRRGLEVHEVLTEARSAKAPGRPIFGSLMTRVSKGEIGAVLCWKMDRLARNPLDSGQLLQALADRQLQQVITPERTYTGDGNDRFLGNFELGIATKFIDDLRANVKRGNRARFQRGWPNYRPPIGYLNDRASKTIISDPARYALVRRMWDELLSGRLNPMQIARAAEEWGLRTPKTAHMGGKPLSFQNVYRLFANPYYMGLIRLKGGESYRGAHQPIVTPDEFEQAQQFLGRPGRSHHIKHVFAYAGLLHCGICGHTMVPEQHVKRSGKRFVYYRCRGRSSGRPCANPALPETVFENQILNELTRVTVPSQAVAWIVENIRARVETTAAEHAAQRAAIEKALADSRRESDALLTLRLRGQVDEETFERRRLGLLDQQARLGLKLDQPAPDPSALLARVREVLAFSASLPLAFREGDSVRRRTIFHAVCANPTVRDRKALYSAKEPFSFFEGQRSSRDWQAIVERLRTWAIEHDVRMPMLHSVDAGIVPRNERVA